MALNFVAIEDGLDEESKLLTMARALGVQRPIALWYVYRWRRFILNYGDHLKGTVPKKYSADDVAAFVGWDGKAGTLVEAMKRACFLGFRRGRGFFYPGWEETVTGRYAARREADRRWHEEAREKAREERVDGRPSVDGSSADASSDARHDVDTKSDRKEERKGPAGPPTSPPSGGDSAGASRWAWLLDKAPSPQNPEVCIRLLEEMSAENWDLVQWAYAESARCGAPISPKTKRTLDAPTDVFLRKGAYLRFRSVRLAADKRRKAAAEEAARKASEPAIGSPDQRAVALRFLLEQLSDPTLPERKKERAKEHWREQWGDEPWVEAPANTNGGGEARP